MTILEKAHIKRSALLEQGFRWLCYDPNGPVEEESYTAKADKVYDEDFGITEANFTPLDSNEALAIIIASQFQGPVKIFS